MQSFWATATLILRRLVLASMLLVSISSCKSARQVVVVPSVSHDTIRQAFRQEDSVYITDCSTERYAPSVLHYDTLVHAYLKVDTLYRENRVAEYRFKLLRDTLYLHRRDTIPKVVTVTKVEKVKYVPGWCKGLGGAGGVALLILVFRFCKRG